ncbi:LuxR C-terminal-related transcriptional regulator [Streptomyces albus subsp. chlorinus]|uniref:helix-turn-helix domain-containing protein n=1 Tax=Streptomyces albus TaxID=1888 RepID=UPI00191E137E|nr:LuxR C-terminal-related transcriptional regulator [Streptomyces albus]
MPQEKHRQTSSTPVTPDAREVYVSTLREIVRSLQDLIALIEERDTSSVGAAAQPRTATAPLSAGFGPGTGSERHGQALTAREREIFRLLLTGASNRQIARKLGIAERTVKNNLHSIYRKLEVAGRSEAIARYVPRPSPPSTDD